MGKFSTSRLMISVLVSTLALSGCGNSRLNPFKWFGSSRSGAVQASGPVNPLIPSKNGFRRTRNTTYNGTPIDQITDLVIERVPGGAILRVTGLAATQGSYDVVIEPEIESELPVDGVLSYRLLARLPNLRLPQGPPTTRKVSAAHFVTDQQLEGVRTIRVIGARNAHTARRR